jgi:hypothetical protein
MNKKQESAIMDEIQESIHLSYETINNDYFSLYNANSTLNIPNCHLTIMFLPEFYD